jgi:hypothetical protein
VRKHYAGDALSPTETEALHCGISRLTADAGAVDIREGGSGRFTTPLIAIHNQIDPMVPENQFGALIVRVRDANNAATDMA